LLLSISDLSLVSVATTSLVLVLLGPVHYVIFTRTGVIASWRQVSGLQPAQVCEIRDNNMVVVRSGDETLRWRLAQAKPSLTQGNAWVSEPFAVKQRVALVVADAPNADEHVLEPGDRARRAT
ncbi:MAG: hypothetical protein WBG57_02655, partial [Ornithinimicrobium sp.]